MADLRGRLQPALERGAYVADAVFTREQDRLFARSWCAVGREEQLAEAGAYLRADVAGDAVVVVRADDGALRAFFDVCRHRGAELVGPPAAGAVEGCGRMTGGVIRCRYHAWTYGLDGQLRRAPFLGEVTPADADDFALVAVSVATWGGFVFVHLDREPAESLADQLGPVPERVARYPLAALRSGARVVYDVAANWKVLAENYNECYHCGPVHPELCDLVPAFRRGGGDALEWDRGIPHREGANTFTVTGTSGRAPFPDLDADERERHKGELVYPNLLLSLARDHVAAFRLLPRAAGRTTVVFDLLFAPDELDRATFDPTDALELWDQVNRQDWAVCESVQRGMASRGFVQGWFAPMEEPSLDLRAWYEPRVAVDPDEAS